MHKHRNTGGTTFFYQPFKTVTEIRSGYLYKSPPKRLTAEKSWKRRYFVLFKVSDQEHYLKYFKSEADRETLHKEIDLSQISLMYGSPEHHQKWDLIQRTMKCSPSCVLYIRTPNRDYFFVGADSDEVDGWFTDLFEALKNRPHTCMSSEEMRYQEQIAKNISKPNMRKKNSGTECEKQQKSQSLCDLYPYERGATGQAKDFSKRPASEPVNPLYDYPRSYLNQADVGQQAKDLYQRHASEPMNPVYDYPRSYLNQAQICENSSTYDQNKESIYVTMVGLIHDNDVAQEASCEAEEVTGDSLVTSTIQVFSKLTARVSPLPQFDEETDSEGRKETPTSDHSSSPPGNYSTTPPVEILESTNMHSVKNQSSTESLDPIAPEERDIKVKQADLKKHLTVTEVDGKPIVSGWTGQPQTVCLFHKGDRILAINDLHVSSVDEFNMYLSRSLKNEVKLTILRLPGCPHLHFSNTNCTDC